MQDGIFNIDVGQIQSPSIGGAGGGRGGVGSGGNILNSLIRYQQRMAELEAARQKQELDNKNELFKGLTKKIGLGAEDDKAFMGFTPMNQHEADIVGITQRNLAEQQQAFANSDGSAENFATTFSNIKKILNNEDYIAAGLANRTVSSAAHRIKEQKLNVHPIYYDEISNYQNAKSLQDYDIKKISNPEAFTVNSIDLDKDLKNFEDMGISFRHEVIGDHDLIVASQKNHDDIYRYVSEKYGRNFELDYERSLKKGQEGNISEGYDPRVQNLSLDEYKQLRAKEMADNFAITEENAKAIFNLGQTRDRRKFETEEDIRKTKEQEKIRTSEEAIREANKTAEMAQRQLDEKYAPEYSGRNAPSDKKGGGYSSGLKNPYTENAKPTHHKVYKDLDDYGIIDRNNRADVINYINSEITTKRFKDLSGKELDDAINLLLDKTKFKFGKKIGTYTKGELSKFYGKTDNGNPLTVRILGTEEEFDLNDYLELDEDGGLRAKPAFKSLSLDKSSVSTKTRFVPENEIDGVSYGGYIYTTSNDLRNKSSSEFDIEEVDGTQANKATGEKTFNVSDKVYKIPASAAQYDYGKIAGELGDLSNIIGYMESNNNPAAKNPASSAYGEHQFIDSTGFSIAKQLGLASTLDEYHEKMKDNGFQAEIFKAHEPYLRESVIKLKEELATDPYLKDALLSRFGDLIKIENVDSVPDYILSYLIHHQGSVPKVIKYIKEGPSGIIDGYGMEGRIRAGFRKFKWQNGDVSSDIAESKNKIPQTGAQNFPKSAQELINSFTPSTKKDTEGAAMRKAEPEIPKKTEKSTTKKKIKLE